MLEDYLLQLIQTHHRVIVPDLGAFLTKEKSALSENAIIFSPFLRFNDGMIEEFLATEKSITSDAAAKIVQTFVQKVRSATDKQQVYPIKKLGAFYADGRGTVQFVFAENDKKLQTKLDELNIVPATEKADDETLATPVKTIAADAPIVAAPVKKAAAKATVVATPAKEVSAKKKTPTIEIEVEPEETAKKTTKTPAKRVVKSATQDVESLPTGEKVVVVTKSKSPKSIDQIDLAAKQIEKWQQTVEQSKAKPQKEVEVTAAAKPSRTKSTKEVAAPTEIVEQNTTLPQRTEIVHPEAINPHQDNDSLDGDDIVQRALKIQRDKMSSLERLQIAKKEITLSSSLQETQTTNVAPLASSRSGGSRHKFAGWLIFLVILAGGLAAVLWFWDSVAVSTFFTNSDDTELVVPQPKTEAVAPDNISIPPIQTGTKVSEKQVGMYYLVVNKSNNLNDAKEFCATLQRLGYEKAEVIHTNNVYVVCIAKAESAKKLNAIQQSSQPYKYGSTWVLQ